jgi:hypothetical protein
MKRTSEGGKSKQAAPDSVPEFGQRSPGLRISSWRSRLAMVLTLAALALFPWAVAAQEQQPQLAPFGNTAFRFLLNRFQLQPLQNIDDLRNLDPAETVVVVFGDLRCLDAIAKATGGLKKFVDRHGALLIASDRPDEMRLAEFTVHIGGNVPLLPRIKKRIEPRDQVEYVLVAPKSNGFQKTITKMEWDKGQHTKYQDWVLIPSMVVTYAPDHAAWYYLPKSLWEHRKAEPYQGLRDCLLVKNHIGSSHPLFARCDKGIATNRPSFIVREPKSDCVLLCAFPPFPPAIDFHGNVFLDQAFAVGSGRNRRSKERLLLVAGHGVFMDGMLVQPDTDNIQFTINIVHWLSEKPDRTKRKYALFLCENEIIDNFNVPIGDLPMPTSRIINNLLRKLEEENFFNQLLLETVDRHDQVNAKLKILRILLLIGVVGLAGYGLMRYRRTRHFQEMGVPLVEAKLAQTTAEFVPALVKRAKLALRGDDFREAARTLAQLCFEQSQGGHHSSVPPRVTDQARDPARLARLVDRLWNLAYGEAAAPVPADEFARLVAFVRQVQEALARGTLRWTPQS